MRRGVGILDGQLLDFSKFFLSTKQVLRIRTYKQTSLGIEKGVGMGLAK